MVRPGKKASVKPRNPAKYEYAFMLFMQKVSQEEICKRVGVSNPTLKTWKEEGGWEGKRAARTISLDDLLQKALQRVNEILDSKEAFNADAFSKAVKQLKEFKNGSTVDDDINTFMSFQDWMIQQRVNYREISDDLIKTITKFQDIYIQFRLGNGSLKN
jgi:transcriptional regulator with XRE-family HTH domain